MPEETAAAYQPQTSDRIERVIANAIGKAKPGAAIDFAAILAIITALVPVIGNCPFFRARRSIQVGDTNSLSAAYSASIASGHFSPAESVKIALAIRDEARTATDEEIDTFLRDAAAMVGKAT